ncbi:delta-like protein 4 [Conger conger]|uniref:delta-like protein 4 n=1 Tax=Conger conger TaxID=82655 RepID=UPI002A5A7E01|nr:delta-like protein 4 [Conger conger]
MAFWFIFSATLSITVSTQVFERGAFELDLHEFKNSKGLLANGNACKPDCKTFFRVCLKNYQAVVTPENCTFGTAITSVLGSNSFSAMGGGTFSSPIRLPFYATLPGSFSLRIEAWYSPFANKPDTNNTELLISNFSIRRQLEVGDEWSQDVQTWKQTELRYSYRFICNEHYYGAGCSKKCVPRDDLFGHYICNPEGQISCLPGWKGGYCDEPICLEGCSQENGRCDKPGQCLCREGWKGVFCDECKLYPGCLHATCQQSWQCNCKEGWGGIYCNHDLNFCTHHKPCLNGATCMNTGEGSYTCSCRPGFNGVDCQLRVKLCDSNPCRNGGMCMDLEGGYECTCPRGFKGQNCEQSLRCADTSCFHNGKCRERDDGRSYVCECPRGFTGLNCEKIVDKCTSLRCANGGHCVVQSGVALCRCRAGFTGQRCEININECAGSPCANGGTCEDAINDYHCVCPAGYSGRDCDTPADPCSARPCLNGGTCVAGGDGQPTACVCPPEPAGPRCDYFPTTRHVGTGNQPHDPFQWAAVALGVGLVALLLLTAMAIVALRCGPRAGPGGERDSDAMNNLSKSQKDNLIPPEQLKNTNKKVDLDSDCTQDKTNYKQNYYYLDHNSTKDFKAQLLQDEKSHNYERTLEEKVPLSRMYREKPECRISTICSPWDSEYQSVFVIAEERNECVIATEV